MLSHIFTVVEDHDWDHWFRFANMFIEISLLATIVAPVK